MNFTQYRVSTGQIIGAWTFPNPVESYLEANRNEDIDFIEGEWDPTKYRVINGIPELVGEP